RSASLSFPTRRSSDLERILVQRVAQVTCEIGGVLAGIEDGEAHFPAVAATVAVPKVARELRAGVGRRPEQAAGAGKRNQHAHVRSEEHTSELQSRENL